MKAALRYIALAVIVSCILVVWAYSPVPSEPDDVGKQAATTTPTTSTTQTEDYPYIEIIKSCGPDFTGACVNVRSGPGTSYPVITRLRNGVVLAVATTSSVDEQGWYKITFNEWIRYPERITGEWYVAREFGHVFRDTGSQETPTNLSVFVKEAGKALGITSEKRILIDRSDQKLYAYEGDSLFMETAISTGLDLTPTPRGTFTVLRKTPSRYMQGPLPGISDQYYDLPGVPWNLYFTEQGGAIHGAYWHDEFGKQYSHGCVNLPIDLAHTLYAWTPLGTTVIVQD